MTKSKYILFILNIVIVLSILITKGLAQPPFEPTEIEAIAIVNIGLMYSHILILMIFMVLMIYSYRKIKDILPIIVIYMFSLMIGMEGFVHQHILTEYSPILEIFFLIFQSSIFILASLDYYENRKKE